MVANVRSTLGHNVFEAQRLLWQKKWRIGTACSGSGCAEKALKAVCQALNEGLEEGGEKFEAPLH
jgi:hypothetical protein